MPSIQWKITPLVVKWGSLLFLFAGVLVGALGRLAEMGSTCFQYPARGTWLGRAPWWKVKGCATRAFDGDATAQCLSNKTLYIIGISTARQFAFSIMQTMGAEEITRQAQKALCALNSQHWEPTCRQEYRGVKIKFLFLSYMDGFDYSHRGGFPYHFKPPIGAHHHSNFNEAIGNATDEVALHPHDGCSMFKTVRLCLQNFYANSSNNDVTIFQMGLGQFSETSKVVDLDAWLRDSAVAFRAHITATFRGQAAFFIALSQQHHDWEHRSANLERGNQILAPIFNRTQSTFIQWFTIDQWAINRGRQALYNDRIHFAGKLTDASVQQILNALCPALAGSNETSPLVPDSLPTSDELSSTLVRHINSSSGRPLETFFFADSAGQLHQFPSSAANTPHPCLAMLQARQTSTLTLGDEITYLEFGSDVQDVCSNRTLVMMPGRDHRSVFAVLGGSRFRFSDLPQLKRMGYKIEQTMRLRAWEHDMLPLGGNL